MKLADHGSVIYHSHSEQHEEALSKGALCWLAPKGPETIAPGKRSAARSKACLKFKSPGRAIEISVAPPGLAPSTSRTPGCASLARGYFLSALSGLGSVSIGQMHVYTLSEPLPVTRTAEHFRVTRSEPVVYPNGIKTGGLTQLFPELRKY